MRSRNAIANSEHSRISETAAVLLLLCLWSAGWTWFIYSHGWLAWYGDAEAHLNIARRILDSRTPGYDQIGTVWLPLLHVLLLPLAHNDELWRTALAGSIVSGAAFVLAGTFLFFAARRVFPGRAPAMVMLVVFAGNPNLLYLQSTAMTEPLFIAASMAVLYFTVRFRDTQSWPSLFGASLAATCGTLCRYDGWFLIPFSALFILLAARKQRIVKAGVFSLVACLGPAYWLAHNWWCCASVLAFYSGPGSAKAIQGAATYPGYGNWGKALLFFFTAARWCAGGPLFWLGAAGLAASAAVPKARWPAVYLLLPAVFYIWSIHSAGTPIFMPDLWPNSYYNTRYGLALLPGLALGATVLASLCPERAHLAAAWAAALLAVAPWLIRPHPEAWITWKESQVNSESRRAWTRAAADYLAPRYRRGSGIITTFGDITGIYRRMGLPLRETLTWDNWPLWPAAVARPDLFLWEEWAVVIGGDPVQTALWRAGAHGPRYELAKTIIVPGAPAVEIYHCCIGLTPLNHDDNSLHQVPWSQERLPPDEDQ